MEYWPEVLQAIATKEHVVYLYFDDGTIRFFDAAKILEIGNFKELKHKNLFVEACTVLNGTLAWTLDFSYNPETCLDLDPDVLYRECPIVEEPHWLFNKNEDE